MGNYRVARPIGWLDGAAPKRLNLFCQDNSIRGLASWREINGGRKNRQPQLSFRSGALRIDPISEASSAPVNNLKSRPADPEPARLNETGPFGLDPAARRLRSPFAQRQR
jgi:hypothetical protein